MKRIISLLLTLALCIGALCSCGLYEQIFKPEKMPLRIGYMAGPTGMGMAKLISDNGGLENGNELYQFTKYTDTATAKADLAAGNVDIICLPTNEAAMYFATVDKSAKVLAVNCLNSLYLLTEGDSKVTSLADLEGQTVYTCKNGTPRVVLEYIVDALKLNITVSYSVNGKELVTPQDLSTCVVTGQIPNAVMPEPLVTSSLLTITKNGDPSISYTVDVDLADEWAKISDTPITMGCILADGDVARDRQKDIEILLTDYKASVEFIANPENLDSAADYVVKTGVMAAAPAAKKALTNLGDAIAYLDGEPMKAALVAFYSAIGVTLPSDSFYYEKNSSFIR